MAQLHPGYRYARRRFNRLLKSQHDPKPLERWWAHALEKDSSGTQCVHFLRDMLERMKPMRT